ncbi:MAG: hypothetical protein FWH27_19480 [Planctomycetaceae bacterium]|nr:hypothetical protein [Planctomycetaceae bacterium]
MMSFTADKNPYRDHEVRAILDPIGRVLQRKKVTLLLLMHHTKADQGAAQNLVSTSVGWINRARAVWQIHKDVEDEDLRLFVPTPKTNDCVNPTAWSFRIEASSFDAQVGKVRIEDTGLDKTADDILQERRQANAPKRGRPSKQFNCQVQLLELLKDGDQPQSEIMKTMEAKGFSEWLIRKAKKSLEIKSVRENKTDPWFWQLPPISEVENVD